MNVPPSAVEAFANQAVNLIPEAQTTIERQDQKRKQGGGGKGGGGIPDAINFTASKALHDLHLLMLTILSEVDWHHNVAHRYRTALDAAKEIRVYPTVLANADNIEVQLKKGRKYLHILAQEIDLPPDPIPLGECECGEPMVATNEQTEVTCRRCELVWEVDERIAHRENKLDDVLTNYIGTAKEIADIAKAKGLTFRRKTISEWYRRGKIEAAGEKEVNGRPAPTFRFEDVRKAHEKEVDAIRI